MIVKEGLFGRKTVEGRRGKGEGNGVNMIEVHYIYIYIYIYIYMYDNSITKIHKNCLKGRGRREKGKGRV
jgi:hypothetical protein